MKGSQDPIERRTRRLRWIARIVSGFLTGYWLLIGVLSAIYDTTPWTWQSAVMALLIGASVLATGVAFFREKLGGILLMVVGGAHSIFALIASGHNHLLAMLISGVPFILVGALYLMVWWRIET